MSNLQRPSVFYGGSLRDNLTQSLAVDLYQQTIDRLEADGYELVERIPMYERWVHPETKTEVTLEY